VQKISDAVKREIINRTDAVAVIGEYVQLKKTGGTWKACCPFHNEKTPSFTVNPDKKLYYCFGCNKGGDIINFLMEIDNLSFVEALELLAKKSGVSIVRDYGYDVDDVALKHKADIIELYKKVAGLFHYFLINKNEGKFALKYIKERALSDEIINRFNLGYAPLNGRWLFGFLRKKGYSEEFLAGCGLFSRKLREASFFRNRLMFPIVDRHGNIVAFGGRILVSEEQSLMQNPSQIGPKYLNSPESELYHKGETLFAIDVAMQEIRKKKEAIICEGYMDVLALHQAGITNAVAPLGTAFTDEQAKLLRRWAQRIFLLFDADEAGQNATVKSIFVCRKNNLECRVISMRTIEKTNFLEKKKPSSEDIVYKLKDPADILKEQGVAILHQKLKISVTDFEFLLYRSKTLFNLSDSAGKAYAMAFIFPFLEIVDSEVLKETYITQIAYEFKVDATAVRNDFFVYTKKNKSNNNVFIDGGVKPKGNKSTNRSIQMNDELYLLVAIFIHCDDNPEFFSLLRSDLPIEEFTDPDAKELYLTFEEVLRGGNFSTEAVLSALKDEVLKNYLVFKVANREETQEFASPEQLIVSSINRIKIKRLRQKRMDLITEIRIAKNEGEDLDYLISEKMFIDEKLIELEKER
jgi:DNA primase